MRRRVGWFGRFRQDPDQGTAPTEVAELIGAMERRRSAAWDVVRLLTDAVADNGAADEILRALSAATPRSWLRLDDELREWHPYDRHGLRRDLPPARPDLDPLPALLKACARDGHERQRALAAPVMRADPRLLPIVVIRTADWVEPVRAQARALLPEVLATAGADGLIVATGVALELRDRLRGDHPVAAVTRALHGASDETLTAARSAAHPGTRRLAYEIWLDGNADLDAFVQAALIERDTVCRARSAEVAAGLAVWSRQIAALDRLVAARNAQVRVEGLTGLVKIGRPDAAVGFLADASALVRATAQWAARRAGEDPVEHYRSALAAQPAAVDVRGLVAGLGEVGDAGDVDRLTPFLRHDRPRVRAEAVRAVARLGGPLTEVAALLTDPAPAVVRAASRALRGRDDPVPAAWLWELLCDRGRPPHVRLGAFNQLISRDAWSRIQADLTLIPAADDELCGRARDDLADWLGGHGGANTYAAPSDEVRDRLMALIEAAEPILGERTTRSLRWYVNTTR